MTGKQVLIILMAIITGLSYSSRSIGQTTPAQWEQIRAARERQEAKDRQARNDQEKYYNPTPPTSNTTLPAKNKPEPDDLKWQSTNGTYSRAKYLYVGYYKSNSQETRRQGHGKCYFNNGDIYEGFWEEDKMAGAGTYTTAKGKVYKGRWKAGKFVGKGTFNSEVLGIKDDLPPDPLPGEITFDKTRLVTPPPASNLIYDRTKRKYDTLIRIVSDRKYGFKDKNGSIVVPHIYDYVTAFENGYSEVLIGDKEGFIDLSGQLVIPVMYERANWFKDGLAGVQLNGKWGFINPANKVIIPLKYEDVGSFVDGWAAVKSGGKWGFINKADKVIIPLKYDYVGYYFKDGVCAIKTSGWGFINMKGEEIIPPVYDDIGNFIDGKVAVKLAGKTIYFDKKGKKLSQ